MARSGKGEITEKKSASTVYKKADQEVWTEKKPLHATRLAFRSPSWKRESIRLLCMYRRGESDE